VDRDAIFVRDGEVVTSAGVTAGIDLALSLVEEDFGPDVARATARYLIVFMARPGGQSQFSVRLRSAPPRNAVVRTVLDAVTADPGADHTRDTLAARAGVSVRHLTRLFRCELGTTATRFVARTRVEAATGLLESGTDTLEVVARRSGFGSEETMRRAYKRELGIAPSTYRSRHRTTGARHARPSTATALGRVCGRVAFFQPQVRDLPIGLIAGRPRERHLRIQRSRRHRHRLAEGGEADAGAFTGMGRRTAVNVHWC
jgi:AraC-like DNA-binding protein